MALASAGSGSNTEASSSGPTRVVTLTRPPPVMRIRSPKMLKLAVVGTAVLRALAGQGLTALIAWTLQLRESVLIGA